MADSNITVESGKVSDPPCLYIIRHGERLDEINPQMWDKQVGEMYEHGRKHDIPLRAIDCTYADSPLTPNGIVMAQEMALQFKNKLYADGVAVSQIRCIYCSRLLRAVQTAYEVAKVLDLPLVISSHFSCTALAVYSYRGKGGAANGDRNGWEGFQYLSMKELATYCPGVQLYSHDGDVSPDQSFCFSCRADEPEGDHNFTCPATLRFNTEFENIAKRISIASESTGASSAATACTPISLFDCTDEPPQAPTPTAPAAAPAVLPNQWFNAIASVCAGGGQSIVVAHRESIRGLEEYGHDSPDAASFEFATLRRGGRSARTNALPLRGVNWRETKLPYCAVASFRASDQNLELVELSNHLLVPLKVSHFAKVGRPKSPEVAVPWP